MAKPILAKIGRSPDHGEMDPMNWKNFTIESTPVLSSLFKPVDIASLVFFRIVYGLIMILTFLLFLDQFDIKANWIDPRFHFHYIGFEWVDPLPGPFMYLLLVLLIFLALLICIGYRYILSCSLFSLGLTYFLLINQIVWDTYFYLAWWISLILIFVPAHKKFSCDAWKKPDCASETTPAWTVWILRFQIAMPYLFGGITKLNEDWLSGFVTKGLFAPRTHLPFIGQFCQEPWFIYWTAYGGLLLDLFLVPMVIFRPFRKLGLDLIIPLSHLQFLRHQRRLLRPVHACNNPDSSASRPGLGTCFSNSGNNLVQIPIANHEGGPRTKT